MFPNRCLPKVNYDASTKKLFSTQDCKDEVDLLIKSTIQSLNFLSEPKKLFNSAFSLLDTEMSSKAPGVEIPNKSLKLQLDLPKPNGSCLNLLPDIHSELSMRANDNKLLGTEGLNLPKLNFVTSKPSAQSATAILSKDTRKMLGREMGLKQPNTEGFRLLTYKEKAKLFGGKRDDLFYKTFVRDVRKFWEDALVEHNKYLKDKRDKNGSHFYHLLQEFERHLGLSVGQEFSSEEMV